MQRSPFGRVAWHLLETVLLHPPCLRPRAFRSRPAAVEAVSAGVSSRIVMVHHGSWVVGRRMRDGRRSSRQRLPTPRVRAEFQASLESALTLAVRYRLNPNTVAPEVEDEPAAAPRPVSIALRPGETCSGRAAFRTMRVGRLRASPHDERPKRPAGSAWRRARPRASWRGPASRDRTGSGELAPLAVALFDRLWHDEGQPRAEAIPKTQRESKHCSCPAIPAIAGSGSPACMPA